jgi:mono/diheme cytochrome c family protein
VREKFPPGQLQQFLQRPGADYLWTRMPDFRLTGQEARDLAAYLLSAAAQPKDHAHTADPLLAERGQKLVQTSGCLNCHSLATKNLFATASLVKLTPDHWQDGCLAPSPKDHSRAPHFAFAPAEREALQAFGASDRASLRRPVAAEFAERQVRLLNCAACHGQIEGFPSLEVIGGKLKPEWSGAFLAGEIPYKPRTWLAQRMPAFPSRARLLAQGLAMRHGYPPFTPAEPPLNAAAAQMGAKLIGSEGGFNCIACHGIGSFRAAAVFESEGINLAYSAVRLLRPYFERWMLNPLKLDPQTKMPMFFEGGRSQLTEILEGDAAKQLDALWQCLRQGERMPFPGGGAQPAKAD